MLSTSAGGWRNPKANMEKFDVQKIRDLPIESVADRLGLKVKKHKALCPFHQDSHPSLSFKNNGFRCFVCGAHGGVIDLAMHVLGKSFIDTCEWIANEHNIILTEWQPVHKPKKEYPPDTRWLSRLVEHPFLNDEARKFLFDERKLNPKVIEWLGISSISQPTSCWRFGKPFYDAPSLLIPYRDVDGKVQNVQSRYLGHASDIPRFKFPSNSSIHIFNLSILRYLKEGEPLFISEGITDCIALLSSGHKAIAIPSATLLNKDDLELLKRYKALNLHIYPDQDAAGEKLYKNLLIAASEIGASLLGHELPPGCKDFSDYYLKNSTH